jgi:hypothetical protein
MSTGRPLRLHLGLRFGTSFDRQISSRAEGFLEEIERLEDKSTIPLYWNFPAAPILEKQSRRTAKLVEAIRKRVGSGQDRIIPCGFSGAPHPLLLPEELQRELLWCYRNPWFPALKNLFDARPEVILPVHPDLYSEAVENAYSRRGFSVIGIPIPLYRLCPAPGKNRWTELRAPATSDYSIRGVNSDVKLRPIALLRPEEVTEEGIDTLLSACSREDALYLMVDLTGGSPSGDSAAPAAVQHLFRLLNRHRRTEFHPFSAGTRKPAPTPIDSAELMKFLEPVGRCPESETWDRIENLRTKKRKSNLQMRDLLKTLAAAVPSGAIPSPDRAKNREKEAIEITSISMAGSVTLIGVGLQATFSQGRLSNLIDHGRKVLPGRPGRSVFTFGNKRELLQTDSAFSFDREGQTGLRSILSRRLGRERKSVQIILDYYFADERRCLNLDIKACYPALPPGIITEAAPLELCLRSFGEDDRPVIEVKTPDREPYREIVAPSPGVVVLWGKSFRLEQGSWSVELLASPLQRTRSEQVEFRVEKQQGKAYLLWVNLGGSYLPQPAANLSTRRLDLSYLIRFGGAAGRGKRSQEGGFSSIAADHQ